MIYHLTFLASKQALTAHDGKVKALISILPELSPWTLYLPLPPCPVVHDEVDSQEPPKNFNIIPTADISLLPRHRQRGKYSKVYTSDSAEAIKVGSTPISYFLSWRLVTIK